MLMELFENWTPFEIPTKVDHSESRHVPFLDPNCIKLLPHFLSLQIYYCVGLRDKFTIKIPSLFR